MTLFGPLVSFLPFALVLGVILGRKVARLFAVIGRKASLPARTSLFERFIQQKSVVNPAAIPVEIGRGRIKSRRPVGGDSMLGLRTPY
jgi:hypothetical protein